MSGDVVFGTVVVVGATAIGARAIAGAGRNGNPSGAWPVEAT
jgi:hypothetical protein